MNCDLLSVSPPIEWHIAVSHAFGEVLSLCPQIYILAQNVKDRYAPT